MGIQGQLTKDKFGFTIPSESPLVPEPPVYYRNMESITIGYTTDADAAARLLPQADELELVEPVTARIVLAKMPFTTFGSYDEAYQLLDVTWNGEPCIFPVRIFLNQDSAMAAGRELWGNPKKLGHVDWVNESEIKAGLIERPKGVRICTVVMRPERPVEIDQFDMKPLGLRIVPNPELGDPSLAELIMNVCRVTTHQAWTGSGSVHFSDHSAIDPWHDLPVHEITSAIYTVTDMDVVPEARVVKRY